MEQQTDAHRNLYPTVQIRESNCSDTSLALSRQGCDVRHLPCCYLFFPFLRLPLLLDPYSAQSAIYLHIVYALGKYKTFLY